MKGGDTMAQKKKKKAISKSKTTKKQDLDPTVLAAIIDGVCIIAAALIEKLM